MKPFTVKLIKSLLMIVFIGLAITCYSMGLMSGFVGFIIVGVSLEGATWFFAIKHFGKIKR